MLSTYEDEQEEESLILLIQNEVLGFTLLKCGCVSCCICDDSHKYYGDGISIDNESDYEDDEYDWG